MKSFIHHNARSINEAAALLAKYKGKARVNAGGTDLLGVLKDKSNADYPEAIINLKTVKDLSYIKEDEEGIKIGALTKLNEIVSSPLVKGKYSILSEAAKSVATPQIRNMCTIGGNLAQDVRCWYYRYPHEIGGRIMCLRKGGKLCNALTGDNRYHSILGAAPLAQYPCSGHCPANTNIPAYLAKIKGGEQTEAARILLDANPMPAITGRVCPIFCEPECNRNALDEPVAIRCIERTMGDFTLEKASELYTKPKTVSGKSVAIIGSGPAGLAAAYYMRKAGHAITVYDRQSEAGGMLRYSIPAYRLPKDVLRKQLQALKGMGINFALGVNIGKDKNLNELTGSFDAVFLASGAWKERPMGIKGERLALSGLGFLNRVNSGDTNIPGKNIAVIGGGNVAVDVARTLLRLGAKPIIIYRRTEKEMPAFKDEIEKAREEGITFKFLTLPTEASKTKGKITLTCTRMKLGAPDASGRRTPVPVAGSDFTVSFDAVFKAIGEEQDKALLTAGFRLNADKKASSAYLLGKNLFAGGDFISGPSTVIQAVASGRKAARLIDTSLNGSKLSIQEGPRGPEFAATSQEMAPRISVDEVPLSERIKSLDIEDAPSAALSDIEKESGRCFNCGCIAVSPSDVGTALVALNASIITNKRTIDAQSFFTATAHFSTTLEADEIVTEIQVPRPPDGARQSFLKFTLRKPVDFAIVSIASIITLKEGVCTDARIALGAIAPEPVRVKNAEKVLKGQVIDGLKAAQAAEEAVAGASILDKNAYKVEIAKALVRRAILG